MLLVSAHAPHEYTEPEIRTQYWQDLRQVLAKFSQVPMCIGIDSNGRIGSRPDQHVGDFRPDETNANGEQLQELMRAFQLFAPSTFRHSIWTQDQHPGTWKSRGEWKRIDFILLPCEWFVATCHIATDLVGFPTSHEDHISLTVRCQLGLLHAKVVSRSQLPKFSRQLMRTPEGKQRTEHIAKEFCSASEQILWTMSADQQEALMQQWFSTAFHQAFPTPKCKPRQTWLSAQTLQLLKLSRQKRSAEAQAVAFRRKSMLRHIAHLWSNRARSEKSKPLLFPQAQPPSKAWLKEIDAAIAWHSWHATYYRRQLVKYLRADESTYIDEQVRKHGAIFQAQTASSLWKALKPLLPKQPAKAKQQRQKLSASNSAFLEHFATVEKAAVAPLDEVVRKIVINNEAAHRFAVQQETDSQWIPSLFDLEVAIRALSANKAVLGAVVPEALLAHPPTAAKMLYPSLIANSVFLQQCASWKAGELYPLHKKGGEATSAQGYRAILIARQLPKLFHHLARSMVGRVLEQHFHPMQLVGRKGMSVAFASQFLATMGERARSKGINHAVVYFDIKSAFYAARKQDVTPNILDFHDFLDEEESINSTGHQHAFSSLAVPAQIQAWTQQALANSWSRIAGTVADSQDNKVLVPTTGTRPGDPLADVAFSSIMHGIIARVVQDLQGTLPQLMHEGSSVDVPPVVWIDDVALYLENSNAEVLLRQVSYAVQQMAIRCQEKGLTLNMEQGKSEVIVRFQRSGSQQVHRNLRQQGGTIPFGPQQSLSIHTTSEYVHLGHRMNAAMNLDPEIAHRITHAQQAFKEARSLFTHKVLSVDSKLMLARALIFSRLLYLADTWCDVTPTHIAKLEAFAMKVFRVIGGQLNRRDSHHTTNEQVWASLSAPPIRDMLRVARIRHFGKLMQDGPAILKSALWHQFTAASHSWLGMVTEDLEWLQQRFISLQTLPPPKEDLHAWMQAASASPARWKKLCSVAYQKAAIQHRISHQQQLWSQKMDSLLQESPESGPEVAEVPAVLSHQCDQCSATFDNHKALAVHQLVAHSKFAAVRHFMPDASECGCCLKQFGSTQKLRQHMQYSPNGCYAFLQTVWHPMSTHEIAAVPTIALKQVRSQYRQPALQAFGPALPTRSQWIAAAPEKQFPEPIVPAQRVGDHSDAPSVSVAETVIDWIHNRAADESPDALGFPHLEHVVNEVEALAAAYFEDDEYRDAATRLLQWCDGHVAKEPSVRPSSVATALPRALPWAQDKFFVLYFIFRTFEAR
eukprot:Skav214979  [mRNA]  locus=scaffold508:16719:20498:- [translate_table: standard]